MRLEQRDGRLNDDIMAASSIRLKKQ